MASASTSIDATQANAIGDKIEDENWTPEQKGKMDADKFYEGWRPGKTWTFIITALLGGIVGLIPAIAISSTTPLPENLGYPNESLMNDARYRIAYEKEARRVKGRKVSGGFGLGLIVAVVVYLALVA